MASKSGSKSALCRTCRKEFTVGPRLSIAGNDIVLTPGASLLASQAGETIRKKSDRTVAVVGALGKDRKRIALKNLSEKAWDVVVDGEAKRVAPNKAILVVPGMQMFLVNAANVAVVKISS